MEQQVFDLILKEDDVSWQSLLMDVVKAEGMDPWDINISKIAHTYIATVRKLKEANLRISGKVVLASAILLHLKSKHLVGSDMDELNRLFDSSHDDYEHSDEEFEDIDLLEPLKRQKNPVKPQIYPKMPQPRHRKVSIQDLVTILEQAMKSKQKSLLKQIPTVMPVMQGKSSVDITSLITRIYKKIAEFLDAKEKMTFVELCPSDSKKDKVYTFIPLLHLYNDRKIELEQEKTFGEIKISMANSGQSSKGSI